MPRGDRKADELPDKWFLRDFCKAPASHFSDSTFRRLSFEQQGVWWSLLIYSMRESETPGWFLDKTTALPMRDDEIAYAVAGSVDRIDVVRSAMQALRKLGPEKWLHYVPGDGWSIPGYADRYCFTAEAKKIKDANNKRQRRKRERDRGAGPPTPIREREAAR